MMLIVICRLLWFGVDAVSLGEWLEVNGARRHECLEISHFSGFNLGFKVALQLSLFHLLLCASSILLSLPVLLLSTAGPTIRVSACIYANHFCRGTIALTRTTQYLFGRGGWHQG